MRQTRNELFDDDRWDMVILGLYSVASRAGALADRLLATPPGGGADEPQDEIALDAVLGVVALSERVRRLCLACLAPSPTAASDAHAPDLAEELLR